MPLAVSSIKDLIDLPLESQGFDTVVHLRHGPMTAHDMQHIDVLIVKPENRPWQEKRT
jgi:hypothetical protein